MILKNIYLKILELSGKPRSEWILAIISFTESSIFPIPPDVLLLPMTLARPLKWIRLAAITTVFSVLGGILGYLIGMFLWEMIGTKIINIYHLENTYNAFKSNYNENGAIIVFIAGFTPIPYKLITIASGGLNLNILTFIIASVLSRGLRFFIVSFLTMKFGNKFEEFLDKAGFRFFSIMGIIIVIIVLTLYFYFK